jgi:hypothetical protein
MKGKKTGGRVAGTPNKLSQKIRNNISAVLDEYFDSETFKKDLAGLDAKDRISAVEKLVSFIVPRMQATTLDVSVEKSETIEDKLIDLFNAEEDNCVNFD